MLNQLLKRKRCWSGSSLLTKQTNKTTLTYNGDLWSHLFLSTQEAMQGTERETGWGIKLCQNFVTGMIKLCQNFVQLGWWVNYESTKFDYSTPNNDFVLQVHKKREAWTGTFSPCLSFPQCLDTKQDLLRVIWQKCCKKLASIVYLLQSFHCSAAGNAP